ncbi:probable arginine--tRNA ligase, mitochondrial isoform X1 [Tachysurus fulvidraco]|uniref:probable arginine--tRNA ligase, mitochondrial isoform X1 n=2 Tax=Tachysurus fulvidraco TaxID=1234273 RepID=UPI001FED7CEE|nr:probable arginine--tRNA ligase, mitochondrial isoform X1 [Tachysurus fulvidraco]
MASFFRRSISSELVRICGGSEDVFIPLLSAVPVSKRQLTPDFRLSVISLVRNGILSSGEDLVCQTERLVQQLKVNSVIEDVTAGRNVITFRINKQLLAQRVLSELHEDPQTFGLKSDILRSLPRGRTLVEYSSPNIAKKFHAGHLRSTIIGQFIGNLKQALGNDVIRVNYLGDWGMQFGLLGAGYQRFGSEEKLKENALQHLFEVYVQVNQEAEHDVSVRSDATDFYRRLEQHEEKPLLLWKQFREITVQEYKRIYQRLGVHFDHYSGESFYQSKTQEVLNDLLTLGLLKTTEKGTGVVDLSEQGDMSSYSTVMRSDGTSLYITRDVAAALDRKKTFGFDEMIYVTDKSQSVHFQQLFQILRVMGHHWASRCVHVPFGLVKGMSTRRGEVVFLEDVIDEARNRMMYNMNQSKTSKVVCDPEQTADQIGISALIIQDFKGPLTADYAFDWERVLQAQGDTGVFLQYTHARLRSLLRGHRDETLTHFDASHLQDHRSISVLQHLLRYDEVLLQSALELQPRYLVTFLLTLSHLVSSAHRHLPVKGSATDLAQARLRLFAGACSVLASGMKILGVSPVEKM